MNALLAIILLTYRESLRKKILLVLVLFCIGLIVSSAFFPVVSPAARIKLVQTWTFQSVTFFGILVAIFLAAVSIPSDIENKRVFLTLTKPVTRETIIMGRLIGFILTTAVITIIMALVGLGYIRLVSFLSPEAQGALEVNQRIEPNKFHFEQFPSPGSLKGSFDTAEKGMEFEVSLEGEGNNFVAYEFSNLNDYAFSDKVKAEINIKVGEGLFKVSSGIMVNVVNPTTKEESSQKLDITYRRSAVVQFDRRMIDKVGDVRIYLHRTIPGSYIRVGPASVMILSPSSFEWNFLMAFGIVFLQIVLVLVFCVTCSSFLSGAVNIFLNMFLYFCGSGMKFLQDSLATMKQTMIEQIKSQNLTEVASQVQRHSDNGMPLWLMQLSDGILTNVLRIIPDFSRFDVWDNLLKGYAINISEYTHLLEYVFIYLVVMLAIGIAAFRLREIK
ncbi:MAG: ABC transporter permease [Planctomycetes bacterium]|nr:ABC transporter permease [Planctomycetota bacterium]